MTQLEFTPVGAMTEAIHRDAPPCHRNDPPTSREAARKIAPELGEIQKRVLGIFGLPPNNPLTAEAVHEMYCLTYGHCAYSTARTRVSELHQMGLIKRWGKVNHHGRNMMAYVVVEGEQ